MPTPLIIAHRGFSGCHPENTLAAVRAALDLGVDLVEIDVQQTLDGQLAVFHDYRLDRLCGVPGRLRDVSWGRLHQLNPAVPTLRQVLRVCRGRARVLVEIKRADPQLVAEEIRAQGLEREVIVFSLSVPVLQRLARINPRIPLFGLVARCLPHRWPVPVQGIGVAVRLLDRPSTVRRLQARGWQVFAWTVNSRSRLERLARWGVDGLITNHPDRAKSVLAR